MKREQRRKRVPGEPQLLVAGGGAGWREEGNEKTKEKRRGWTTSGGSVARERRRGGGAGVACEFAFSFLCACKGWMHQHPTKQQQKPRHRMKPPLSPPRAAEVGEPSKETGKKTKRVREKDAFRRPLGRVCHSQERHGGDRRVTASSRAVYSGAALPRRPHYHLLHPYSCVTKAHSSTPLSPSSSPTHPLTCAYIAVVVKRRS